MGRWGYKTFECDSALDCLEREVLARGRARLACASSSDPVVRWDSEEEARVHIAVMLAIHKAHPGLIEPADFWLALAALRTMRSDCSHFTDPARARRRFTADIKLVHLALASAMTWLRKGPTWAPLREHIQDAIDRVHYEELSVSELRIHKGTLDSLLHLHLMGLLGVRAGERLLIRDGMIDPGLARFLEVLASQDARRAARRAGRRA